MGILWKPRQFCEVQKTKQKQGSNYIFWCVEIVCRPQNKAQGKMLPKKKKKENKHEGKKNQNTKKKTPRNPGRTIKKWERKMEKLRKKNGGTTASKEFQCIGKIQLIF